MTKLSLLLALCLAIPACTSAEVDPVDADEDIGQTSSALGSPADLTVSLIAPTNGVGGARGVFQLTVRNEGGTAATTSKVLLTMPSPMSYYSSSPRWCNFGPTIGTIACDFGTLQPNQAVNTWITVALPFTSSTSLSAVASTTSPESSTSNNTAATTAALAPPPPPVAVVIPTPKVVQSVACAGIVPSFAACMPGSYINNTWTFLPNGTLLRNNVALGVWTQPNGPESLRMEFRNGSGTIMGHYDAMGVSSTCFQGFMYSGAQSTNYSGVFQLCVN